MATWKTRRPTTKHRLEFAGLYVVFWLGQLVPRRHFVRLGTWIGRFVFDVLRVRRDVTLDNLRHVFGEQLEEAEIVRLGRRSYEELGGSLLEFCSLWSMSREEVRDAVEIENLEVLERIRAKGIGCIMVTGHYGNWEVFGAAFVEGGQPTTFLVKEQKNPLVARLQDQIRERGGIGIVKEGPVVARGVLRALREHRMVGILPDQDARRHGVFVEFLGRVASTYKGPAFFAVRAGVPIVPAYVRRLPDGSHRGTLLEPIWPDPQRGEEEEIFRLTQAYSDAMTTWIRQHPEHYFWVHRRFKTPPPDPVPWLAGYRREHPAPEPDRKSVV